MEKSVMDLPEILKEQFGGETADIRTYSPLVLAYIGDGIYDLVIRTLIVRHGSCQPNKLHKRTSALVKASAQSEMIDKLMESLTEEELAVYKRGRNAKSYTMAKNATMHDYRKATGMEAVMGFLYLEGRMERLLELVGKGDGQRFVCSCGYKEKLSIFQERRKKEGAGVSKRDVQRYLNKQKKEAEQPLNNAFAEAFAKLNLKE